MLGNLGEQIIEILISLQVIGLCSLNQAVETALTLAPWMESQMCQLLQPTQNGRIARLQAELSIRTLLADEFFRFLRLSAKVLRLHDGNLLHKKSVLLLRLQEQSDHVFLVQFAQFFHW